MVNIDIEQIENGWIVRLEHSPTIRKSFCETRKEAIIMAKKLIEEWVDE